MLITQRSKAEEISMMLEYEFGNKLHNKIGLGNWQIYRRKVPNHIPVEQRALFILKIIRKDKKEARKRKFYSIIKYFKLCR